MLCSLLRVPVTVNLVVFQERPAKVLQSQASKIYLSQDHAVTFYSSTFCLLFLYAVLYFSSVNYVFLGYGLVGLLLELLRLIKCKTGA